MSAAFESAFERLRALMLAHTQGLSVTRDGPGDLVVRTLDIDPKTREPGWFGTVTIKKSYVAYHLTAIYEHQHLMEGLPPELETRRQGKTCFNFKTEDAAAFEALSALTARVRALVD